ncbi:MAG: hypothetical protein Q4P20_11105 [Eubacteriales bacterium]|nr:hypothetical protein [Eubacteriales bacterium]
MKTNDYARDYMEQYENTDVIITDITEFLDGTVTVFDTNDGKHWFSDNNVTCEVATSLCDGEIIYDDNVGYLFHPEYWDEAAEEWRLGEPQEIEWVDE